jgi:hypothetical protein
MTKKHSTPRSFKRYNLPKTLLIGAVTGVLATISNGVLADCDSTKENCVRACHDGIYTEKSVACAEERNTKYDDCGSFWAQMLMTREERDTCRAMAYTEYEACQREADNEYSRCRAGCYEAWEQCS